MYERSCIRKWDSKQFFAKINGFSRTYDGEKDLGLFLWRVSRTDQPCENPLHPDFVSREIRKGQFRPADVTIEQRDGVEYIIPKISKKTSDSLWKAQGTSLFDRPNTFKGKNWEYVEIPEGTKIPDGLLIIKDDYNERFEATHYSISPNHAMSVKTFKLLIKNILNNIDVRRGQFKNA